MKKEILKIKIRNIWLNRKYWTNNFVIIEQKIIHIINSHLIHKQEMKNAL